MPENNTNAVINATTGYVNGQSGAVTDFDNAHTLDPEIKSFYDTELLENARAELFFAQFGKRQPLPARHGGTVEWRKWNTFEKAEKLQEGVIPTGQKFGVSRITGAIDQYGTYTAITDRLELRAYDDIILGATEEMGASAAETQETLTRDTLMTNTNVFYCHNVKPDGTPGAVPVPTSCAQMGASDADGWAKLTPDMVSRVVTQMKKARVPGIHGKYVAIVHPSVAYDLRSSDEWIEAHKYASPNELFNGEIGELHGCRFVEDVFAPVLGGDTYKNKSGGVTYATFFLGRDAFGIIDPEGGALEVIVHDKEEIGGPLNQFSTVGYKFETNGATILYPERCVRVMSTGAYSASDETNYSAE